MSVINSGVLANSGVKVAHKVGIIPADRKKGRKKSIKNNSKLDNKNNKKKVIKRKGSKHDWISLRNQYIEGIIIKDKDGNSTDEREFLTLKGLGELTKVSYSVLRERSAVESWQEQREGYQVRLAKSRQLRRINLLSTKSIEFDDKTLKTAEVGIALVLTRLAEILQDVGIKKELREKAIEEIKRGGVIDFNDLVSAIDSKELSTLASAAQVWQQVGNKAVGSDVIKHELQIDASLDVDIRSLSLTQELGRDDPERLAQLFNIANRAGLLDGILNESMDAELIDDDGAIDEQSESIDELDELNDAQVN